MHLAYHYNDSLASADTEKRCDVYSINSFPSVVVGGIDLIVGVPNDGQNIDFNQYVAAILESDNARRDIADIQLTGDFDAH
jgi:hypothetical protein